MNPKDILSLLLETEFKNGLEVEFKFVPTRKWRFDYAWPDRKIAVEYEGIIGKSRHTSVVGYTNDCDKYNAAAILGWVVIRFTPIHFSIGIKGRSAKTIDLIREVLSEA